MKIEIRSENEVIVSGYVNAVERNSKVLNKVLSPGASKNFVEKIKAGTFSKAISKAGNIELRFNHRKVIGDTKSKSLFLEEDNIGLYAKAVITDKSVITEMRSGLQGWSFGFIANHEEWSDHDENTQCRSVDDITLREVSILTIPPAYAGTSIEMRGEDCKALETRGYNSEFEVVTKSKAGNIRNYIQHKQLEILKLKSEV